MYESFFEFCIAITLTGIAVLLKRYRRRVAPQENGYFWVWLGLSLMAGGSWVQGLGGVFLSQMFWGDGLDRGAIALGYGCGSLCLGLGFWRWLPELVIFQENFRLHRCLEEELRQERQLLQGIFNSVPGALFVGDRQGQFLRWNRFYRDTLGLNDATMRQMTAVETVLPEDRALVGERLAATFAEGYSEAEFRVLNRHNELVYMYGFASKVNLGDTLQDCFVGMAVDVSELKRIETELIQSKQNLETHNRFLALAHHLTNQLHRSLDQQEITYETVETLGQYYPDAYIGFYSADGMNPECDLLQLQAHHNFSEEILRVFSQLTTHQSLFGYMLRYGKLKIFPALETVDFPDPLSQRMMSLFGGITLLAIPLIFQRHVYGLIMIIFPEEKEFAPYEISTLRSLGKSISLAIANAHNFQEIHYQARHDTLTKLGNRSHFHETMTEWLLSPSLRNEKITVMLLDLDRFKEMNDTLGHQIGNEFLQQIASRLSHALESYNALICRLGGDEFAIAIPMLGQEEQRIQEVINVVHDAINQPFVIAGTVLRLTASIGVAILPDHGQDSHKILRCADVAMYDAKQHRNRATIYHADIDHYTPRRLSILSSLSKVSSREQFFLHYQPKLDIKSNKIIGLEALIRWQHPTLGRISPAEFIPLAELSDAIHTLTYWIWESAFQQQQQWKAQGLRLAIALNFSACSLQDPHCFEIFTGLMEKYDILPGDIELEITETALMLDPDNAIQLLGQFANLGVQLAIDDFGTGYSSLSYLKQFPVNALKIDQSFVMDMAENDQSMVIVKSTINLAHNLGLKVIAEGVENQATVALLSEMDCDVIQGYFISRPVAAEKIQKLSYKPLRMVV